MNSFRRRRIATFIILLFMLVLITGAVALALNYDENSPSSNSDAIPYCSPEWLTPVTNGEATAVAALPLGANPLPTCRLKTTTYIVPTEEVESLSRPSTQKP